MANYRPTASETGVLTRHLIRTYGEEKGKGVTRVRISSETVRTLANRRHLRDVFIADWIDDMADSGWSVFPVGDNFAVLQTDTIDGWPRIASKRIRGILKRVHNGDLEALDEIDEAVDGAAAADEDDD